MAGKGRLIHSNGDIYIGQWENDKSNGKGTYIKFDGTKYEGDWVDDQLEGFGIEIWPNGGMKENIKMGKNQVKGSTYEMMVIFMKESSWRIIFQALGLIIGLLGKNTKDIGKIIKWRDMGNLNGLMEGNTLVAIKMTSNMDMELSLIHI
eukprot:TRINITY_DN35247_c0_g1_i1.p2 TRINITY_DN35247_c0_g1~~TRINITY_DN35247_c0_g1_i1.p2  ORF type:complete len:149 (-),score=26.21 TRINITY_DN35247_c0_g1_i1:145-591(-)